MNESQQQFILSLLAYAVQRGASIEELCRLSNINLRLIGKGKDFLNEGFTMERLWLNVSFVCKDDLVGLHFGESLQLGALGIVGEIIQKSSTVGEAVLIATSLTGLLTDQFRMEVRKSRETFAIRIISQRNSNETFGFLQLRDFLMVFTIHELDGLLLKKINPLSVMYPSTRSAINEYQRVFRCRPRSMGSRCIMEFDLRMWSEPIITANYDLHKALLTKLTSRRMSFEPSDIFFKDKVSAYLASNSFLGIHSLNEVAANFNMSPRSVQRKLRMEGVSFQQLVDTTRKMLALHYASSGYQVKEISSMLGYKEISAFSRAFKRWTGRTPASYAALK